MDAFGSNPSRKKARRSSSVFPPERTGKDSGTAAAYRLGGCLQQDSAPDFLKGGGELGELMRSLDWTRTAIGAPETWSPALRTLVRILLANRFPLLLWWGPSYVSIYNDAYRPILGRKHPTALGLPVSECWNEIWHVIKPLIDTPFQGGPLTWIEDLELELRRSDVAEEAHFTVAYSPVPDETVSGGIGGVLATVHEITGKVIGERRVVILRDLGTRAAEAKTAVEACSTAALTLSAHAKDLPFTLLYLIDPDGKQARLAAAASVVDKGVGISPLTVRLDEAREESGIWHLAIARRTEMLQVVEDLSCFFADVPSGPWSDPPHQAVVLPIRSNIEHQLSGFLVAGISSRLKLDDTYLSFLDLAATQTATAIANARAFEEERRRADAVSHEFRTPLTLMLGPLETLLAQGSALLPADREQVATAHRNSLRLLKLVNSLLDFTRIEAGRVQATYEPIDLAAFTNDLASNFRSALQAAGLEFVIDCTPLPQPARSASLGYLNACIQETNMPVRALVLPSVDELLSVITGASGSNPGRDKDRTSGSLSPAETAAGAKRNHILIVEDNMADVFLIREALALAQVPAEVHVVNDSEKALRFIDSADGDDAAPCPVLIVLDLNLPKKTGAEVLLHLRKSRKCGNALVVIATSSDSARDREEVARLRVDHYFRKPSAYDAYMKLGEIVKMLLDEGGAGTGEIV